MEVWWATHPQTTQTSTLYFQPLPRKGHTSSCTHAEGCKSWLFGRLLGWSNSREVDNAAGVVLEVLARFVPWLSVRLESIVTALNPAAAVLQEEEWCTLCRQCMFDTQKIDFQQCVPLMLAKSFVSRSDVGLVLIPSSQKACYCGNKTPLMIDLITCCEAPAKKNGFHAALCFWKSEVWVQGSVSIVMPFKSMTSSFTLKWTSKWCWLMELHTCQQRSSVWMNGTKEWEAQRMHAQQISPE